MDTADVEMVEAVEGGAAAENCDNESKAGGTGKGMQEEEEEKICRYCLERHIHSYRQTQ